MDPQLRIKVEPHLVKQALLTPYERKLRQELLERINLAGGDEYLNRLHHPSQLLGTPYEEYYNPGPIAGATTVAGAAGMAGSLGHLAVDKGARWARKGVKLARGNPSLRAAVYSNPVTPRIASGTSKLLNSAAFGASKFRPVARKLPFVGGLLAVPEGLEIGEHAANKFNVHNKAGRFALKAGGAAASLGSAWAGAKAGALAGGALGSFIAPGLGTGVGGAVGGVVGGLAGAFAPTLVNNYFRSTNDINRANITEGARRAAMNNEFKVALNAKRSGDSSQLNAWYGAQKPGDINKQIGAAKNWETKRQIWENQPVTKK